MSYQVLEKPVLTDRVKRLKDSFFQMEMRVSLERSKFVLEAYKEAAGEAIVLTRAKVFDKYLKGMTLYIDENPIVGSLTRYRRGANQFPELLAGRGKTTTYGAGGLQSMSEEEQKLMIEASEYFRGKAQVDKVTQIFGEVTGLDRRQFVRDLVFTDTGGIQLGFINMDYGKVLNKGLEGVVKEVEEELAKLSTSQDDFKKREFYKAAIISLQAVIAWANRYAALADEMAAKETDAQRRVVLKQVAEACRWVPAKPARTFYEAVQSFWLIHAAAWIEAGGIGISPGRFPQYMYPFYKKDVQEGSISKEEAIELLELLFIKFSEIGIFSHEFQGTGAQLHTGQAITLGGFTPDGEDATNEVDFLVLEAEKNVRMIQPSTVVVWHNKLSSEFLMKCLEVAKIGLGKPAFINGHVTVERHLDRWKCSLEEAYDISNVGCVQTAVNHAADSVWGGLINFPKVLELTLNNGRNPSDGKLLGLETGEAENFKTYEELKEALRKQLFRFIRLVRQVSCIAENVDAEYLPTPLGSIMVDDCLKRGKDLLEGGARFGSDADCVVGVIDVANSMAAIRKLVFEEKKFTMKQIMEAIRANFEGYEEIQRLLLAAPKYGNEDPYVDKMVREWYDEFCKEDLSYKSHLGLTDGRPHEVLVSTHGLFGRVVGALPNGRKAGTAITDGSISATPGTDRKGPTAVIHSAAGAMNTVKYSSNIFNVKFHPTALSNDVALRKLGALIKTYMDMGGFHIQFNVVDAKTLRDAQQHPDKYRDLVVRVAGYSAFFVYLDAKVQEEIISRTELKF